MRQVLVLLTLASLISIACETKKNEKKVANPQDLSPNQTGSSSLEAPRNDENCDSATQSCLISSGLQTEQLYLSGVQSWLNPWFNQNQVLLNDEGPCYIKVGSSVTDSLHRANLDLELNPLNFQVNEIGFGIAGRCRVELNLVYKQGWAFALRKVSVPLLSNLKPDAIGLLKASYGFRNRPALKVLTAIHNNSEGTTQRIDRLLADQDIIWSSCSGKDILEIDTQLSMNFLDLPSNAVELYKAEESRYMNGLDHGTMALDATLPYRFEIVWAQCQ